MNTHRDRKFFASAEKFMLRTARTASESAKSSPVDDSVWSVLVRSVSETKIVFSLLARRSRSFQYSPTAITATGERERASVCVPTDCVRSSEMILSVSFSIFIFGLSPNTVSPITPLDDIAPAPLAGNAVQKRWYSHSMKSIFDIIIACHENLTSKANLYRNKTWNFNFRSLDVLIIWRAWSGELQQSESWERKVKR